MWLFVAFLMVPLIEIALFIQVGGWIGLWPTLAIVVLTAVAGTVLVRSQGAAVLARLRSSFETLRDPTEPLAHGAMILFSGALLLTPGFFTDTVGFLLLVPAVRAWVLREASRRIQIRTLHMGAYSGVIRPLIPKVSGHPFRFYPATDSGASGHPCDVLLRGNL